MNDTSGPALSSEQSRDEATMPEYDTFLFFDQSTITHICMENI